jgi:glucose/mannose-6-phosphate isomerase
MVQYEKGEAMIDREKIQELDNDHIFDLIGAQPDQLRRNYADTLRQDITAEEGVGIQNVVLCGMGGSALAANIFKNWMYDNLVVPFEIVRGYSLPDYIGPDSLVILSSYSGNTEETLSAYEEAKGQNARIATISAGGELTKLAQQHNQLVLELPTGMQPRLAVFAGLKALACLFEDMRLVAATDLRGQLINTADYLDMVKFSMSPDDDSDNVAMGIAEKIAGKVALIYAGPALGSAAYKWKININENANQLAFYNTYPELNHNEFQGWQFPTQKPLVAIQLESDLDTDRIKRRMEVTKQLLADRGFDPIAVKAQGKTFIDQLLSTILLGDYISAYAAILNGVDPTPVELVEKLKVELKK